MTNTFFSTCIPAENTPPNDLETGIEENFVREDENGIKALI